MPKPGSMKQFFKLKNPCPKAPDFESGMYTNFITPPNNNFTRQNAGNVAIFQYITGHTVLLISRDNIYTGWLLRKCFRISSSFLLFRSSVFLIEFCLLINACPIASSLTSINSWFLKSRVISPNFYPFQFVELVNQWVFPLNPAASSTVFYEDH